MEWLGLDIGGAHLKIADGRGYAAVRAFAMWSQPQKLAQELRTAIAEAPRCSHLAVTMTGELADCFPSKTEGVRFILEAVRQAADGRHARVYLTSGAFVSPPVALQRPLEAAAANWHALARLALRYIPPTDAAVLIDIGSTTCDIVPLVEGQLATQSRSDTERLLAGELVYCGVERTPLCSLVEAVPYRGRKCPVARELFATTRDVYVLLGDLPEDATSRHTADGRAATKAAARERMGRMICADETGFNHKDAVGMAQAIADVQAKIIARGLERVVERMPAPPSTVVLSGQGEFLVRRMLEIVPRKLRPVSLAAQWGPASSRCAPAYAVAVLARESVGAT